MSAPAAALPESVIARAPVGQLAGRRLAVTLGGIAMLLLYAPILWLMVLSFSARPLEGIPWPPTLAWYRALGDDRGWAAPLVRSVQVALVVMLLATAAAALVGRALPAMRRRNAALALYLVVIFLPGIVVGLSILIFWRGLLGIRTGFWSVVLAHFIWAFPFALLCVLIVAARFDRRLLEAAADLGADARQRFWQIELPLLRPGLAAAAFFSFLLSFNELPRTLYVRGPEATLPFYLWTQSASHSSTVALVFALSTAISLVSLVLTAIAIALLLRAEKTP